MSAPQSDNTQEGSAPTTAQLMKNLLQRNIEPHFYLLRIEEGVDVSVTQFADVGRLAEAIRAAEEDADRNNLDVSVYPLFGYRFNITAPPWRHLITPWGPVPLQDMAISEVVNDGFVGRPYAEFLPPAVTDTAAAEEEEEEAGETATPAPSGNAPQEIPDIFNWVPE